MVSSELGFGPSCISICIQKEEMNRFYLGFQVLKELKVIIKGPDKTCLFCLSLDFSHYTHNFRLILYNCSKILIVICFLIYVY